MARGLTLQLVSLPIEELGLKGYLYKQGELNTDFKRRYCVCQWKHIYYVDTVGTLT